MLNKKRSNGNGKPTEDLENRLGIRFKDKHLLENAFVHRSYLNENPKFGLPSNERLEYLGDAALELIVSHHLFEHFPKLNEGELTALRAALVRTESLAEEAKKLDIGNLLLLSKGEEEGGGRNNPYLLANAFEALIGALFLDHGLEKTTLFVRKTLLYKAEDILRLGLKDAKSLFQEQAQERYSITPTYRVLEEWGPDHAKRFRVGVFLKRKKIKEGEGRSKQAAEEDAARKALKEIANQ